MKKLFILLSLIFINKQMIYAQSELLIPSGSEAIIIPKIGLMYSGSKINIISNNYKNLTVEITDPTQRPVPPKIKDILERETNICDVLNSLGGLKYQCYKGTINNIGRAGAGNFVVECLPSQSICFIGVINPN